MRPSRGKMIKIFTSTVLAWSFAAASLWGQYPQSQQPPAPQYPPAQQGQYPPANPYPQQQGQYPQQQYPPQGQYPPPQQYPPQQTYAQPPMLAPQQLDQLVGPIALYPDGLLAQVLSASTYYNQIPEAANWANQHGYLNGPALAQAIQVDQLPWDPSVIALLPFPQVLNYLASNMGWTQALGNAVLTQRPDVMDSVQRMRQQAYDYGYLRSNQYERVVPSPGYIEIAPITPGYYYVPWYDPRVVFIRPRPGFYVGTAIRFGPAITVGAFLPWGWGGVGFGWREHVILVDHRPWVRSWNNRAVYVHPYAAPRPHYDHPYVEHHDFHAHEEHGHEDRGHEHDRERR